MLCKYLSNSIIAECVVPLTYSLQQLFLKVLVAVSDFLIAELHSLAVLDICNNIQVVG